MPTHRLKPSKSVALSLVQGLIAGTLHQGQRDGHRGDAHHRDDSPRDHPVPPCYACRRPVTMSLGAILTLGFFLGMRHATDADHVVAVTSIVSRERSLRSALPIGILWGVGHTVTVLVVGGVIILLGIAIPPRLGLGMELSVAVMLVALGTMNLRSVLLERGKPAELHHHAGEGPRRSSLKRPLLVGIVHGLAGSAAVALLVLGTIRDAGAGVAYLLIFGLGTIAGMFLVTTALALPVVAAAGRFERLHRALGGLTGLASVCFGVALVYQIGFVHGLFTSQPHWSPQ